MKNISYVIQPESIAIIIDQNPYIVRKDSEKYSKVITAAANKDIKALEAILDINKTVKKFTNNKINIIDNEVFFGEKKLHGVIVNRILEFFCKNLPFDFLEKFIERIEKNPSANSKNQLYTFLENKFLPITEDGYFLAYKGVRKDYYSVTAGSQKLLKGIVREDGRIFNGVGEEIEMERNEVDDNINKQCSFGLHVGSYKYASGFSERLVLVKVDPASVVSVPLHSDFEKCRLCHYWVIAEISEPLCKTLYGKNAENNFQTDEEKEPESKNFQELEEKFRQTLKNLDAFDELDDFENEDEDEDEEFVNIIDNEPLSQKDEVDIRIESYIQKNPKCTLRKINNSLNPLPWQPYETLIKRIEKLGFVVNKDSKAQGYRTVS